MRPLGVKPLEIFLIPFMSLTSLYRSMYLVQDEHAVVHENCAATAGEHPLVTVVNDGKQLSTGYVNEHHSMVCTETSSSNLLLFWRRRSKKQASFYVVSPSLLVA